MKRSDLLHALREECGKEPLPPAIHSAVVRACSALPEHQSRRPIHWLSLAPKLAVGLLSAVALAGFSVMLLINLSLPADDPQNSRGLSSETSSLPEASPSVSPSPLLTEEELRPLIEEQLQKALTAYYRGPLQADILLKHLVDPERTMAENAFDWEAVDKAYQEKYQNYGLHLIFTEQTAFTQRIKCIGAVNDAVEALREDSESPLTVDAGIAEFSLDSIQNITETSCKVNCRFTRVSAQIKYDGYSFRVTFPYRSEAQLVNMKLEDGLWKVDEISEADPSDADVSPYGTSFSSLKEAVEYIQSAIEKDIEIVLGWKEPPKPEGPYAEQNGFIISDLTTFYQTEQSDLEAKFSYISPPHSAEGCTHALFREDGKPEWWMGSYDRFCFSKSELHFYPDNAAKQIVRFYKNESEDRLDIDPGEIEAEFTMDLETLTLSASETWKDKNSPLFYDRDAYLNQRWYFPSYSATEYDPELPVQVLYATSSPYYVSYSGECLVALAFAPGVFREMDVRAEREDGEFDSSYAGQDPYQKLDHFILEEHDRRLSSAKSTYPVLAKDCVTGPYLMADDFPEGTEFCVFELSFSTMKTGHPIKDGETITLSFRDPEDYHQILYETSFAVALPQIDLSEEEQLAHVCTKRYQPYIVVPKE